MTGVHASFTGTQSDSIAEVIAGESGHFVLETSPPDYVEKISRFLELSEGQSRHEEVCNVPAEADSDSGDSLFITQKPGPQAVRSLRRRRFQLRSEDGEESEEHDLLNTSHDEDSEPDREKRRRTKCNLPKYNFPFVAARKLKLRRMHFPDQNKSLLNYTIGGFFKCIRELRRKDQRGKDPKASLPTVDMDGEEICPLSEEDEDGPEVEDIKVVEKKCFVVPLKAKRQKAWCKASTAGKEASQGEQTKLLDKMPTMTSKLQVIPVTSVTESSGNDGNFLDQREAPNTEKDIVLFLENAREDELDDDSDATVCEPENRETSTPVTEPQTEQDEGTGQNEEEPDDIQRREVGDIPVSKRKKKKREKSESVAESVGQEVDGHSKSEVEVEKKSGEDVELKTSGVTEPVNDDAEVQKKRKKKKKKEEGVVIPENGEEEEAANRTVDLLQTSKEKLEECGNCLEMSDSTYVKKKKQKKKRQSSSNDADVNEVSMKKMRVYEWLSSSNTPNESEKVDETSNGLEGHTAEVVTKKKKKKKKKSGTHTPPDDAAQHGGEGADGSVCLDPSVSSMKKMRVYEWLSSSNTQNESGKVDETSDGLEGHGAEVVTKKKKKKKKTSEDKVAQSDDSVSVREKEKKRSSSFLVADVEENDAQTEKPAVSGGEEELSGVRKKKKKRKMTVAQSFEEPSKTLPETTETEVKRKKKHTGSESVERLESAADEGISPTGEAVVVKKKKRKDKPESEDAELVALKKVKPGHSTEISHDSSRASDTLSMAEHASPGNHLNPDRGKKRKKMKVESAELEPSVQKKKDRKKLSPVNSVPAETSLSTFDMSSSDNMKNKHRKVKRRLHNPSEDFLSDS